MIKFPPFLPEGFPSFEMDAGVPGAPGVHVMV